LLKSPLRHLFTILLAAVCCQASLAQKSIAFQNLNTSNGLSYLGVNNMCVDKKGNLWIATGNGLNMFNGKTVDKYYASEYPQLQSSNVVFVTCDGKNRIWVLTAGGNVTMLDERRQMHRVGLYKDKEFVRTSSIINSRKGGIILWTRLGHYFYDPQKEPVAGDSITLDQFAYVPIKGFDSLQSKTFRQVFYYDEDHYIFVREEAFYKVNYRTNEVERKYTDSGCTVLVKWNENELLCYDRASKEIKAIDLLTEKTTYPFRDLKDQFGKPVNAVFRFAARLNADEYILTTLGNGMYMYNRQSKKIYNHTHNVTDPYSIGNNNPTTLTVGNNDWAFIACNPNGISYFNSKDFIGNKNVFTDGKGNGFDGYIAGIATKDNNTYYIGTAEGMLQWERNTNTTNFINFPGKNDGKLLKKEEVTTIIIDDRDRVWAGTTSEGIIVMDRNRNLIRQIKNKEGDSNSLKLTQINQLLPAPDGFIWVCGRNGICKIDPSSFKIHNLDNTPLSQLNNRFCTPLLFVGKDDLWFAASRSGVFHYNIPTQKLDSFSTRTGLISNGIFSLNCDSNRNIYIGANGGLNILYTDGRIKTITKKDGLLIDRAEGLLLDKHNRMWIGNDIGIACYNIADSSIRAFDERYGLSVYGFRVWSYFQTPNGEFIFGTPKGLQYFHPDSLYNKKITLNALISKIETEGIVSGITENSTFKLTSSDHQVTFYFSSVDYTQHLRTYYEYMLVGADKAWVKVADQNSVRYNSLPPGTYTFKVRISNDNKNWQDAENEVTIVIATAFYKSWWFRLLATLLGFAIIIYVINYYQKQQAEKRSRLETELAITYFASQINTHKDTEELLWDVAKNCISKLNFEDCVIYLKDETTNRLVQKAAYGPKNPVDFTIHQPIEIPVGQGITGHVAQTGKGEIIEDTLYDKRYVVDDTPRRSEIAVPIIINGKVVGVIDSEHSQKNFFTQKHFIILQTIAVLCANQMQKTKAEEEKQKTTQELWENKQKAAESRLQSLRLQMNPHFLFNALNSIQQMILANEEMIATRYLSRFSKLLRTVLIHSDKEAITLKDEIEILKMYVELESVRFKESFTYSITCDEEIETEEIKIPTLLIQPFVENAIWHGLMHKEGDRHLDIIFTDQGDFLQCVIEDNGVGRQKASEIKSLSGQDKKHISKGIAVSEERIKTLKNSQGKHGTIQINDLVDAEGQSCGTQIVINFPIQN
jgi:ligand-binding sensor domain-containing protein/putative methionine-R-sulfoxide reductase with GAF domain